MCSCETACRHSALLSVLLGAPAARRELGNIQGEAELSRGLSVLILCSGIRTCASQIYPYVTKKQGVPAGYQLVDMWVERAERSSVRLGKSAALLL